MCGRFRASRGLACTELSLEVGKQRLDSHGAMRGSSSGWWLASGNASNSTTLTYREWD